MRRKFLLGLAFAIIAQVAAAFAQEPAAGARYIEIDAKLDDFVEPRDTIIVPERFF